MNTNRSPKNGTIIPEDVYPSEKTDSQRYAELCNQLRPASLKIPSTSPHLKVLRKFIHPNSRSPEHVKDGSVATLDGIAMTEKALRNKTNEKEERTPSSDSNEDSIRLLLCVASLELPSTNIIPEYRIRTPRTPRTPAGCQRCRTSSPVDESRGKKATTPTDLLIHRYKSMTPKFSDFLT